MRTMPSLSLLGTFLACVSFHAAAEELRAPETQIRAKRLRSQDEVSYTPHSVSIEQPASDVHVGETLKKLPGVQVRNRSGLASLTTVTTAQAFSARGTAITIDDIPVIDATGEGVNYSLFPSTLIGAIDYHSPFYPSLNPESDTLPAPGGRINLRTLEARSAGATPLRSSFVVGSGRTAQGSLAYAGRRDQTDWVVGLTGFSSGGDFRFRDPVTNSVGTRGHNDAAGAGALGKIQRRLRGGGTVEVLGMGSRADRTNPGPIGFDHWAHERDSFGLIGVRYLDPQALGERDGLFAKAAASTSRLEDRDTPAFEANATGSYFQAGYSRKDESSAITFAFDDQYEALNNTNGVYFRNVFGATLTVTADIGAYRLIPQLRQDGGSGFRNTGDASLSLIRFLDANSEVALSAGLQHAYPSLLSRGGMRAAGYEVLPNPGLGVERDSVVSISYNGRNEVVSLFVSGFYNEARNRSTWKTISTDPVFVSQAVGVPARGWGGMLDAQFFSGSKLSLRTSLLVARTIDTLSGEDLPFKPRFEGGVSASLRAARWLSASVEEEFIGKRFVSTGSVATISPYSQTNLRLDAGIWRGTLFFKVSNVFDAAGYEYPGYPQQGRSFWLGYNL